MTHTKPRTARGCIARCCFPACALCAMAFGLTHAGAPAQAQLLGPRPYLCFADSPFVDGSWDWFYLETFEDGALNTPGVTTSDGSVISPPTYYNVDSVDCDDGVIDGSGLSGRSFYTVSGAPGIRIAFSPAALGKLPTHAGIIWTDGVGPIRFEAFDADGLSLGVLIGDHADGNFLGATAEDRFYGAAHPGGISALVISCSPFWGMEIDHLQYGRRCAADYNHDSFVDGLDYDLFNADFENYDPTQQIHADYNGDGFVDGIDYDQFNYDFETGC